MDRFGALPSLSTPPTENSLTSFPNITHDERINDACYIHPMHAGTLMYRLSDSPGELRWGNQPLYFLYS